MQLGILAFFFLRRQFPWIYIVILKQATVLMCLTFDTLFIYLSHRQNECRPICLAAFYCFIYATCSIFRRLLKVVSLCPFLRDITSFFSIIAFGFLLQVTLQAMSYTLAKYFSLQIAVWGPRNVNFLLIGLFLSFALIICTGISIPECCSAPYHSSDYVTQASQEMFSND